MEFDYQPHDLARADGVVKMGPCTLRGSIPKNGKYKIISFFAKRARGAMARFIIQNQLDRSQSSSKRLTGRAMGLTRVCLRGVSGYLVVELRLLAQFSQLNTNLRHRKAFWGSFR